METSEAINEIASALSKAQGAMGGAVKDSANPFFKSKYADLESVWQTCRKPLADNGLAVVQTVNAGELGIGVTTMLTHSSGQWIKDTAIIHPKDDGPQALGSAIKYMRRYALEAIAGVYSTDDDGEAAQGRGKTLNGLPKIDPRGEAWEMEDQEKAKGYAERLRAALKEDKKELVVELHKELNPHPDFYIAVGVYMEPSERNAVKAIVKTAHEAAQALVRKANDARRNGGA